MAEMVPDRLPRGVSKGEERIFELLKRLPDDCIVYYEPIIRNKHPDFVVIIPTLGLLIIEVKGWYAGNILGGDNNKISVILDGHECERPNPIRQARDYMWSLVASCQEHPQYGQLVRRSGEHKGRFIFPFANLVIFSNMDSRQMSDHPAGNLWAIFPTAWAMSREELLAWEDLDQQAIIRKMSHYFRPTWKFPPLTSRQIDVLRAVIHPEIRISPPAYKLSENNTLSLNAPLTVLDLRQERNARKLGDGHRIIFGVAGSGKTVILVSRARLLHQENPNQKILVLCFNVALAAYLRAVLADCDSSVSIFHFDGWAKHAGITRKRNPKSETDEALGQRLLENLSNGSTEAGKYDAVLIDEAQDFVGEWFKCALLAMKDPNDGDLIIVGDGSQGIRHSNIPSWKSLGINARGRSISRIYDLDKNYRSTREIVRLASSFAANDTEDNEDRIGSLPMDPSKTVRSNEIIPRLLKCNSREEETTRIVDVCKRLLGIIPSTTNIPKDIKPGDIGILYPRLPRKQTDYFDNLVEALRDFTEVVWLSDKYKKKGDQRLRVSDEGIKIQTIDSSKGLQYRVVILIWTDLLPHKQRKKEEEQERRKLFVALTRAEDILVITYSDTSKFVNELAASPFVKHIE